MKNNFKIDGAKIIAPDGGELLIKGVNVNGPGWVFKRDTLPDIELILDVWNFNSIRLCAAIGWEFATEHNKDLDGIIKAFTDRNIIVMLEVHDYTGSYPPDEGYRRGHDAYVYPVSVFKDWWIDKANRFKENPYVWFNIMNEPGPDDSKASADSWYKIHNELIEAIRTAGAENIIVLDEHGWGQGSGYRGGIDGYASAVIRMGPKLNEKYDNLVYSLHVYDAWYDGKLDFDNYFKDAKDLGLCVILGEFGVGKGNISQHSAIKAMYNSAIPNHIGRMYWAWDDGGLPLTENGCGWAIDKTDGTMPDNLTWVGKVAWLDTHGLLEAPVPEYNLPLLPNGDFKDRMTGWQNWGRSSVKDGEPLGKSGNVLSVDFGGAGGVGRLIELKPGTKYQFSAWGKNSAAANTASTAGIKYSSADNPGYQHHETLSFTENEWTYKSLEFTTPEVFASASSAFIWKIDANTIFYITDMELVEIK
jgi:hypothetical protein